MSAFKIKKLDVAKSSTITFSASAKVNAKLNTMRNDFNAKNPDCKITKADIIRQMIDHCLNE